MIGKKIRKNKAFLRLANATEVTRGHAGVSKVRLAGPPQGQLGSSIKSTTTFPSGRLAMYILSKRGSGGRSLAWHDDLVAGDALGRELVAVAVVAEQRVLLVGEGLVRQRAVAAETAEAVLMVVPVLVEEFLGERKGGRGGE